MQEGRSSLPALTSLLHLWSMQHDAQEIAADDPRGIALEAEARALHQAHMAGEVELDLAASNMTQVQTHDKHKT